MADTARGDSTAALIASRYRRERLLGRGGMGEVHAATDLHSGRRVAVKLMLGHRLDSPDARARFEREARVGARLTGEHLVEVVDAGVEADGGTPYIVMELLDGEDLEQRLARLGPRPPREVVEHLGQVALALASLAAARVVHRDLKPSNVFLDQQAERPARVKLLDLGIVKELRDSGGSSTGIAGTPLYMAPEQISGGALSPATDGYALGLIAFTLLAGAPYWAKGDSEEPIALALRMRHGTQQPATARAAELGVTLPAALDAWFTRATARRPERRFRSPIAAVHALARALGVEAPAWLPSAEPDEPDGDGDGDGDDADARDDDRELDPRRLPLMLDATATAPPRLGATASAVPASSALGPAGEVALGSGVADGTASAAPRRNRRRFAAAAAAFVVAGSGAAAWLAWPRADQGSPLARRDAILACPALAVDGDVADERWLGAAAAAIACERARVLLGGLPARTMPPAELLDLPGEPSDTFPVDPYGADTAHATMRTAARRRAAAYLDGSLVHGDDSFTVELVLRRPDGREVARGRHDGRALEEAVRLAMQPLIDRRAIPTASFVDPEVADFGGARDVEALLSYVDLHFAFMNNAGQLGAACAAVASRPQLVASDLGQYAAHDCAYTVGARTPPVVLSGVPDTAGAQTIRARVVHMASLGDEAAFAAWATRLEALNTAARSPWARSSIAATLSCLRQAEADATLRWAQRAVQHEHENVTGELCTPWGVLFGLDSSASVARGVQAWQPWWPYGWLYDEHADQLAYARRAYLLSPGDAEVARLYSRRLLDAGHFDDARLVAVRLEDGGNRVQVLEGNALEVRILAARAQFSAALTRALDLMKPRDGDDGWVRAQRLAIATDALSLGVVLGREHEVADAIVAVHVFGPATAVADLEADKTAWLPTICGYASPEIAARCFTRLDEQIRAHAGVTQVTDAALIAGARLYAQGDLRGAAREWRPLVVDHGYGLLAEAMVQAFAAVGNDVAVADVLASAGKDAAYNGASMVVARAAIAAHQRGDHDQARQLARKVIDAWAVADVEPAILAALDELVR